MPETATPITAIDRGSIGNMPEPLLKQLKALLSLDFDAHDARLIQCLLAAQNRVEKATGLLLDTATVTISWSALYDYERLPYGPVTGSVTVTDLAGNGLTGITLDGDFPTLTGDYPKGIKLVYQAGYDADTLPFDLAECVLNLAANYFDFGTRDWKTGLAPYRQYTWAQ